MKFRGSLLFSTVFLGILAWINTSQADPIEKALKLIRVSSKSVKPISKLRKTSVPKDTNRVTADIAQLNRQEAALILSKRQFTKDSVNPVLYHALALLPNSKESDAQLHLALPPQALQRCAGGLHQALPRQLRLQRGRKVALLCAVCQRAPRLPTRA